MPTPLDENQRMSIWDSLRRRFRLSGISMKQITSREKFIQAIRKSGGLRKYQRAAGREKGLIKISRQGDFWRRSQREIKDLPTRRWKEHEERFLLELSKHHKGRELVSQYNLKVRLASPRTYSSITVKLSKLKHSK